MESTNHRISRPDHLQTTESEDHRMSAGCTYTVVCQGVAVMVTDACGETRLVFIRGRGHRLLLLLYFHRLRHLQEKTKCYN